MPLNREEIRRLILEKALEIAPFEGWNRHLLVEASRRAGLEALEGERVFPNGISELIEYFTDRADERMRQAVLANPHFPGLKIREKIACCVKTRLEQQEPYKEAIRRALAFSALPANSAPALRALYNTVDAMWRLAGDTSTDFNFYTKRALLSKVYTATLLYWLNDRSENHADSWAFLNRRIGDVMAFGKWKAETQEKCRKAAKGVQKFWNDWRPRSV